MILAIIHAATAERIAANERAALLEQINRLIAADAYDNNPLQDQVSLPAAALHSADPVTVYRARRNGTPVAAVYVVTSPHGYNGRIRLVVGVRADQTLAGVRVVSHRETPGLGDRIEAERSDWIEAFSGKSLDNPQPKGWAVQKDGGVFDQFTGATITPRAVVNSVRDVLIWAQQHQDALFRQAADPAPDLQESPS
ncbi:MAG: electron transport complex subunit RsxG [Thiolinea sp.]